MSSAYNTVVGYASYLTSLGDDLFKNLYDNSFIDKSKLIQMIEMESSEFEVIYANPYFMQEAIGAWTEKYRRTFDKWIEALQLEYIPLENYRRTEHWTDESDGQFQNNGTDNTSTNSSTTNTGTTSGELENTVSAFDSSTYSPKEKQINSSTSQDNGSTTGQENNTTSQNGTNSNDSVHNGLVFGNIGVTTSQKMLTEELEVDAWNLYQHIVDLFLQEFCIMVY